MGGGPIGWDLARGRITGLLSMGVADGIKVCEGSNSSDEGTMESRITLNAE